jgi:hypothetical protein
VVQGRDSADDERWGVLDQPALEVLRDLTGVNSAGLGRGTQWRASWKKGQLVDRRSRVSGVLQHEVDQTLGPPSFRRWNAGSKAVAVQRRNDRLAVHPQSAVALPEVPLIRMSVRLALMDEVAGTATDQESRHGLGAAPEGLQELLVSGIRQVCRDAIRHHGPDFTQGEWAGDKEEVAHGAGSLAGWS